MKLSLALGCLIFFFTTLDVRSQGCKEYLPEPGNFPSVTTIGKAVIILTAPDGSSTTREEVISFVTQPFLNILDGVNWVYNSATHNDVFSECEGAFRSYSEQRIAEDSTFRHQLSFSSSQGKISLVDHGTRIAPCAPVSGNICLFETMTVVHKTEYEIKTGHYTLSTRIDRHRIFQDANGATSDGTEYFEGTRSGTWKILSANKIEFDPIFPAVVSPSVRRSGSYAIVASISKYKHFVTVKDEAGNPKVGVQVRIRISGDNSSGGHNMTTHAPGAGILGDVGESVHGWLALPEQTPLDDNGVPVVEERSVGKDALGGSVRESGIWDTEEFRTTTDGDGRAHFVYIPGEVSGLDTLSADVVGEGGIPPASKAVRVAVAGLTKLSFDGYPLKHIGVTPAHPENNFATQSTISALQAVSLLNQARQNEDSGPSGELGRLLGQLRNLGYKFADQDPSVANRGAIPLSPEPIFVNDLSLKLGGLFDVAGDLTSASGHGSHRSGTQADLKSSHWLGKKPPYKITSGAFVPARDTDAIGDPLLDHDAKVGPYTNQAFYPDPITGNAVQYNSQIRKAMNGLVRKVQHRRLLILLEVLGNYGTFAPESDHIHITFKQ